MVAGIALAAAEPNRAIDRDRQIGVDLDQALIVALVPIVRAPWLPFDELHREALVLAEREMRDRAPPATG